MCPNAPATILQIVSSIKMCVCFDWYLRVPSKPSIVFSPQKPSYSQPNYPSWWLGNFWCLFQAIQLIASSDVNRNKAVAETASMLMLLQCYSKTQIRLFFFPSLIFSTTKTCRLEDSATALKVLKKLLLLQGRGLGMWVWGPARTLLNTYSSRI